MKRQLSYILPLSIFFAFFISVSYSQKGIIRGAVKNGNEHLPAATVSLGTETMATDQNGEFYFSVKPGSYTIVITHTGFNKIEQTVLIKADTTVALEFEMAAIEQLGEIVILGSRSAIRRSNLNTAVPVDAISYKELDLAGQESLSQKLNVLAPSFNASRQLPNETITLRGLDPDHVLILLNGIRYHSSAYVNQGSLKGELGRGSVANDINSIPISSIEKIEILRDGAAAQYGSDAIAGVINIQLKKSTGKTAIHLRAGQFYEGDGQNVSLGINRGFVFAKKGFLNFSLDLLSRQATYRGGHFDGTVYKVIKKTDPQYIQDSLKNLDNAMILQRHFDRNNVLSNIGDTKLTKSGILVNSGFQLNDHLEFFGTTSINFHKNIYLGQYRFPKSPTQVNTVLFPDGFKVKIAGEYFDLSAIAGIKGITDKGWNWNFTGAYGSNSISSHASNTNNATQSAIDGAAQTEFYQGGLSFSQQTNTLNFSKDFVGLIKGIKSLNLAFGSELRFENYKIKKGEEASWQDYSHDGREPGTQGLYGYSDLNAVNKKRTVTAGYIDLEVDVNNRFLFDVASRYEYYNDFGSNLAGKFALRYKITDIFSIRGSASTGFHAPGLQQRYISSTQTVLSKSGGIWLPVLRGTFRNDSYVAQAFGVPLLVPEKSINLNAGITSAISRHIDITVDMYMVQIKNRIVLSGIFDTTVNRDVKKILANIPGINQVQFFTNAINTRTVGIDIVMNAKWKIHKTNLGITFAANFNRNYIFGDIKTSDKLPAESNSNTLFNIEERGKIESGQPRSKIILSTTLNKGKFGFLLRCTRFGSTATVNIDPSKNADEFFSAKILTDISISYSPKNWLIFTLGANNVLNVYPDPLKNYDQNTKEGIFRYSNDASPFGYNGGYYFLNMAFNF